MTIRIGNRLEASIDTENYRKKVLKVILDEVQPASDILAAWEGGSSATGTKDQFSDIDLCLLTDASQKSVLDRVEKSLQLLQISHTWQPAKSFWGEGLMQRVVVLKDSPKYFSVDIGVFSVAHPQLLKDFLEIERHGHPIVYFDKVGAIVPTHTDTNELFRRQQARAEELNQGFPIFKSLVLKEIERGKAIDAISFYQNGLVRPLVEVLGMIYRPYKFDFGMRYIHSSFPDEDRQLIEKLCYVASLAELSDNVVKVEQAFDRALQLVRERKSIA